MVASVFVFPLHLHILFGFECLMQPVAVTPAKHEAAGEFVHDEHLPILHDIILIALEQRVRLERLQDVVVKLRVLAV